MRKSIIIAALLARAAFAETVIGTVREGWNDPANQHAPDITMGVSFSGSAPPGEVPPGAHVTAQIASAVDSDGDSLSFFWRVNVGTVTAVSENRNRIEIDLPNLEIPEDLILSAYAEDGRGKIAEKIMRLSIGPRLENGTLLHVAPTVYAMSGGMRWGIPSAELFNAFGWSWAAIRTVSQRFLASIPEGPVVTAEDLPTAALSRMYPDGTLITQPAYSPTVYVMEYGRKRGFTSGELFHRLGYLWEDLRFIPTSVITRIPDGPAIGGAYASFAAGTLLRTSSRPHFYSIDLGGKRWITGPDLLTSIGFRWSDTVVVSEAVLDAIPSGPPLIPSGDTALPIRTVFKSDSAAHPEIYELAEGPLGKFKRHITSPPVFEQRGHQWSSVRILPHATVMRIPTGPPLW